MKAVTLLLAVATFAAHANHDEHESHSHGAHEHGHGHLNLVVDGDQLMIELQAPAADLVGFEHAAKSEKRRRNMPRLSPASSSLTPCSASTRPPAAS